MSVLQVNDLSVFFTVGERTIEAVRGVSFEIGRAETFALVGESGAGKSVTALSVMGLLPPRAFMPAGKIRFLGRDLLEPGAAQAIRGGGIAMIFQEPMTSLNPLHTVEKQIGESLRLHKDLSQEEVRARVKELLELVKLPEAHKRLDSYPHQLSGGQRQRVMIAMTLAGDPDLLIADEPTTALDVTIQAEILDLLKNLQSRFNMSILLITHDLLVVRKTADRVGVMKDGKIVETGETGKVFTRPEHEYTRYLLASELKDKGEEANPNAVSVVETVNLNVRFPLYKGLFRRAKGYIHAVRDISVTIREGQTVGLVGESGSGKTTFGLAVLRLVRSSGTINFRGMDIQDLHSRQVRPLRKEMQIIFQDPFASLNPRLTVGQIIGEGLAVHGSADAAEREVRIGSTLREVGLTEDMAGRYPHEFSGGQRQRICIARTLVLKPKFLVLDEPTSALDMSVQTQILTLLRDLQERYSLAYLIISHDLRVVRALSHEILVIKDGAVVEHGPSEKVLQSPEHPYTRDLIRAVY